MKRFFSGLCVGLMMTGSIAFGADKDAAVSGGTFVSHANGQTGGGLSLGFEAKPGVEISAADRIGVFLTPWSVSVNRNRVLNLNPDLRVSMDVRMAPHLGIQNLDFDSHIGSLYRMSDISARKRRYHRGGVMEGYDLRVLPLSATIKHRDGSHRTELGAKLSFAQLFGAGQIITSGSNRIILCGGLDVAKAVLGHTKVGDETGAASVYLVGATGCARLDLGQTGVLHAQASVDLGVDKTKEVNASVGLKDIQRSGFDGNFSYAYDQSEAGSGHTVKATVQGSF